MLIEIKGKRPSIDNEVFIAYNSTIIGECTIGQKSSIWFNAVIRGDDNKVEIGKNTNIQDGCIIHSAHMNPTIIGNNTTVGHGAIIHACKIGDNCLIGMGSIILDGAIIGKNVIIGANSLITAGKNIPDGCLVIGSPGKIVRELSQSEIDDIKKSSEEYVNLAAEYKAESSIK